MSKLTDLYKVGDRVTTRFGNGTVVYINNADWRDFLVQHDDKALDLHSGLGVYTVPSNTGWFFSNEDEVKPLAKEADWKWKVGDYVRAEDEWTRSFGFIDSIDEDGWICIRELDGDLVDYAPDSDITSQVLPERLEQPLKGIFSDAADWDMAHRRDHMDDALSYTLTSVSEEVDNGQATRYNSGKAQLSFIALDCLGDCAKVMEFGAKKYARDNWRKGMPVSKILDSLLRHISRIQAGEWLDPESGLPHIGHLQCNAMFLGNANNELDINTDRDVEEIDDEEW